MCQHVGECTAAVNLTQMFSVGCQMYKNGRSSVSVPAKCTNRQLLANSESPQLLSLNSVSYVCSSMKNI